MERALILSGGGARGAFQVGVLKFLQEMAWVPDLVCGTSAGAINAVAMGSGMRAEQIARIWKTYDHRKMHRIAAGKYILSFLSRRGFKPLMDPAPLKSILVRYLDIEALRRSETEIIITAINIRRSQLKYFDHRMINMEHVMASHGIGWPGPYQSDEEVRKDWISSVALVTSLLPFLGQEPFIFVRDI